MSQDKSLPKVITITLDDGKIVIVRKLALGKYMELIPIIERLFTDIIKDLQGIFGDDEEQKDLTDEDFIKKVPGLVMTFMPEAITIISVATGLEKSYVQDTLGLDEAIEIVVAIIKTNNFSRVAEQVKNLIALFRKN